MSSVSSMLSYRANRSARKNAQGFSHSSPTDPDRQIKSGATDRPKRSGRHQPRRLTLPEVSHDALAGQIDIQSRKSPLSSFEMEGRRCAQYAMCRCSKQPTPRHSSDPLFVAWRRPAALVAEIGNQEHHGPPHVYRTALTNNEERRAYECVPVPRQ